MDLAKISEIALWNFISQTPQKKYKTFQKYVDFKKKIKAPPKSRVGCEYENACYLEIDLAHISPYGAQPSPGTCLEKFILRHN
jgi:hypothetical protein